MHELSIVMGIIKIAEEETKKINKSRVNLIELEIGSLSGVEIESLEYVWEAAVKNTVLEQAKCEIDFRVAKAKCLECKCTFELKNIFDCCPKCNSYFKDIIQGKELRVKALEVN